MGEELRVQGKRLVLMLWALVTFFYFYLSYDYIRVTMDDRTFGDDLQYVAGIAGTERRPVKEIRELILVKAEDLTLPVRGDQISINGLGQSLDITVNYSVDIEIPLFERVVYTKNFNHEVKYRQPR